MPRTKAKSVNPKFSAEVAEIFSQLKNDGLKLSMLKEAALIKKLSSKHKIKPVVIQKQTRMSLPHVYNLLNLASMSPKMKAYVMSGKLKGTDAISILRKAKDEKEFVKLAEEVVNNKVDRRLKENKINTPSSENKKEEASSKGTRGRGRPRKETSIVQIQKTNEKRKAGRPKKQQVDSVKPENNEVAVRKEKIKNLIMNFFGKKITKIPNKSITDLVEHLIAA